MFHRNDSDNFHMTKGFRKELQQEMGIVDSSSDGSPKITPCDSLDNGVKPNLAKKVCPNNRVLLKIGQFFQKKLQKTIRQWWE